MKDLRIILSVNAVNASVLDAVHQSSKGIVVDDLVRSGSQRESVPSLSKFQNVLNTVCKP